jgi:AcrR family transcriptional regulator
VRSEQLLDVAEQLFVAKGFAATSIEDIARAAGITRPVVYGHFGTKEGVYVACVRRSRTVFQQLVLEAVAQTDDPEERLVRGADALFALLEHDPGRWKLLFASATLLPDPYSTELEELRLATIREIAELVRLGLPDTPPDRIEACAHAISGIGERLGLWWLAKPSLTRAELVEHFRATAWPMLSAHQT